MGGFGDYSVAAGMRDVMVRIAEEVVNRLRPEMMIGEVYEFNYGSRTARIRLPGHTVDELLQVRFAEDKVPRTSVADNPDDNPDVVRIAGKPGSYWISDYVRGAPRNMFYEAGINPPGTVLPYAGTLDGGAPFGYLPCFGQFEYIEEYPILFSKIGHNFNRDSTSSQIDPGDGTFRLPDSRVRILVGAGDVVGGAFALGMHDQDEDLSLRIDRMIHLHSHSITPASYPTGIATPTGTASANQHVSRAAFDGHDHSGNTGESSALKRGNYHAWQAVNYIIKV